MTGTQLTITIITSLISGLLGALISSMVYVSRENRMFKVQTLKRFAANRYDIRGDEFSRALNEVFVVFNKHNDVMINLNNFFEVINQKLKDTEPANDALALLFKSMCDVTNTNYSQFSETFFINPFNGKRYG